MTMREPDEFDRIVAGIEFEDIDEQDFTALENQTLPEADESSDPLFALATGSGDDLDEDDDLPDFVEVTYRHPTGISTSAGKWRQAGWLALAGVPCGFILLMLAKVYVSPVMSAVIVIAAIGLLGYLLWTNPDRSSSGESGIDGSSV